MKTIKANQYKNVFEYKAVYTMVDNGRYPLCNNDSVFWTSIDHNLALTMIDGKPCSKTNMLFLYEIEGLFAVYDDNMKCVTEKYETIFELLPEIEDKGLLIYDFEYQP